MALFKKFCTISLLSVLTACQQLPQRLPPDMNPGTRGALIVFEVLEEGRDSYVQRLIISEQFLRIDDGNNDTDFLLFDRLNQRLLNVVHEEKTISTFRKGQQTVADFVSAKWSHVRNPSFVSTTSLQGSDSSVNHVQYLLDEKLCFETVSTKNFPDVLLQTYAQYLEASASAAQSSLSESEYKDNTCELEMSVVHPGRLLQEGFPLRLWRGDSYARFARKISLNVELDKAFFQLPQDYTVLGF